MTTTAERTRLSVKLNNGALVLAKLYKGRRSAMTFSNLTQAQAAAHATGGWVWQGAGRPFYVRLDTPSAA